MLAFAPCSKDDEAGQQNTDNVRNSNGLKLSNKTFSDSITTIKFEGNCVGSATISIDVDTAIITVNAPFTYSDESLIDYVGSSATV